MKKRTLLVLLSLTAMTMVSSAQSFTTLVNLDTKTTGYSANLSLQGIDGNLYGTMSSGGAYGYGTIFRLTPRGQLTTLYNFCATGICVDGEAPGPLVQGTNSALFGTTGAGGAYGYGTIFTLMPTGEFKTLYSFCSDPNTCADGYGASTLVLATNGNFYGLTTMGAAGCVWPNIGGAFFEITPHGTFTVLAPICVQDALPPTLLAQGNNEDFYAYNWTDFISHSFAGSGAFFRINPQGSVVGAWSFCVDKRCDVSPHLDSAIEVPNGDFWGTWQDHSSGGIFRFTESGQFRPAYHYPGAALTVFGSDGNLYGRGNGAFGDGAVIEFTPSPATLRTIHDFTGTDGNGGAPSVQDTNGDFYGVTYSGGAHTYGTIFRLSTGLSPFVETLPSAGKSGTVVFIKGTAISGATQVAFNGVPATFVTASPSALKAIVPADLRGPVKIEVTLPSGLLQGNAPFRVLP